MCIRDSSHILPSSSSPSSSSPSSSCSSSPAAQLETLQPTSHQPFQRKCTCMSLAPTSERPVEPVMPNSKKAKGSNRCNTPDPLVEAVLQLSASIQSSLHQGKQCLEHQTYAIYVAERMGMIKSKRTLMRVRREIDAILDDAIMAELSD